MASLPPRFAPFIFGLVQSAITTGVSTAIATFHSLFGAAWPDVEHWLAAWLVSWLVLLPIVIGAAPFIQRTVSAWTRQPTAPDESR